MSTSRSFGDFSFKLATSGQDVKAEDHIISKPEVGFFYGKITEIHLDFTKDDFVLLACDGLFETMNNEEVIDFVNSSMSEMSVGCQDAQRVAEDLVQHAMKLNVETKHESDNISVIIIPLTRGILRSDY